MTSIAQDLIEIKIVVISLWFFMLFLRERLNPMAVLPAAVAKGQMKRWGRNLGLFGINTLLSPLIVLPLTAFAAGLVPDWRWDWWRGLSGLLLDILILDGLIYWWHRANHAVPFLWRFHVVHHLDRFLDTTTALRFHFGEVFLSACARATVIILIGFPFETVIVFEVLVLLSSLFHHSNITLPEKFEKAISYIVVTPSIHWVHHHAVQKDTDSNYATVFSLWDRLFKSRSRHVRTPDMPIGVAGEKEDKSLILLLKRPF